MKRIGFNRGWEFTLENGMDEFNTFGLDKYSDAAGAAARFYDYNNWERVDLPHDWTLSFKRDLGANTFAGAYPNTRYHRFCVERHSELDVAFHVGWYRKQFMLDPAWEGKRVFVEFEGVFRDATVFVNGVYLDRHTSGYTGFLLELTDHLVFGEENSIAVRVDTEQNEGWWYEGAGIYRNVNLYVGEPMYFKYHQTVVRATTDGVASIFAVLVNDTAQRVEKEVCFEVLDADNAMVATAKRTVTVAPFAEAKVECTLRVEKPHLWCLEEPYLYALRISAGEEETEERFGIREAIFDADRGFLLNGKVVKLRGACVHQDFGGVGVALSDNLNRYKIARLKEMGVNAYRCAHHAPSPALLAACDELGMLVMDETRTFGTSPEAIRQLTDLVERDRNHPCVVIWSLGNEEFSVQNKEWSHRLLQKMTRITKSLDPTRAVTYGGNNGADFTGANGAAEVRGVNYIRNNKGSLCQNGFWLDEYHKNHPTQPIIGTEESSFVLSRGGAVNDLAGGLLDATGNVTMPWGSTPKGFVKYFEERDYLAGGFMWTGFDYRGEPNPFYYQNVVSSFGTIDLCGMEKPPFYYYRAWWTDEPVLKLAPHWNHGEGDVVAVSVFTNCEEITLSLNGKVLETRRVERFDAPIFYVPFEAGVLSVEGTRNGVTLRDQLRTAGKTAKVRCTPVLMANGEADVSIYQLDAYDADGVFAPLAAEEFLLDIENGEIIGVGNGDPACLDRERIPCEEEILSIDRFTHDSGVFLVPPKAPNEKPHRHDWLEREEKTEGFEDDFRIVAKFNSGTAPLTTSTYKAILTDVSSFEYVEFERLGGESEVYLNGEPIGDNKRWYGRQARTTNRPYRFYCSFKQGENELAVVSKRRETDAPAMSGYVRLGRSVAPQWRVKLHFGKARVFVRSKTPKDVVLRAKIK